MEKLKSCDINKSIVITQHKLRRFIDPSVFENEQNAQKSFQVTIWNFISFCYENPRSSISDKKLSFKDLVVVFEEIRSYCNGYQIEAISLIVKEMLNRHEIFFKEIKEGKRERDGYIEPLNKRFFQGRILLGLKEVFLKD